MSNTASFISSGKHLLMKTDAFYLYEMPLIDHQKDAFIGFILEKVTMRVFSVHVNNQNQKSLYNC